MLPYERLIEMLVSKLTTEEEKRSVRNIKTTMCSILLNMTYNEQNNVRRSIGVNLNYDDFMLHNCIMADLFTGWEEDWLEEMYLPATLDPDTEYQQEQESSLYHLDIWDGDLASSEERYDLYSSRQKELVVYLVQFYSDLTKALNNSNNNTIH